jgi:uncharacterized protein
MRVHDLTAAECADVLARNDLARVACARDGQPYVVPVHYSYDPGDRCLYAFSAVGQKIEWMRQNPRVCVEVEEIADRYHWTTVVAMGRYEELQRTPEHAAARQRAERLLERRDEWWMPGAARTHAGEHSFVVVYRILLDRLTGRRADRDAG